MKKIVLVFAALIGIESSIYADIPLAVSTKTSSSCDMQANGNPAPMTLCFRDEVELIKKYINYNLSHAPAYKRKNGSESKKRFLPNVMLKTMIFQILSTTLVSLAVCAMGILTSTENYLM